nr:MAG TPA: hypothetical protein [Caudoviricetes sp.]
MVSPSLNVLFQLNVDGIVLMYFNDYIIIYKKERKL